MTHYVKVPDLEMIELWTVPCVLHQQFDLVKIRGDLNLMILRALTYSVVGDHFAFII